LTQEEIKLVWIHNFS